MIKVWQKKCGGISNIKNLIIMKKIQIFNISLLAVIVALMFTSCYEEEVWLEDNIITTGEYYPVIYMNSFDENEYQTGESVEVVLEFFSKGTLEEIILYEQIGEAEKKVVSTTPYEPAFSQYKSQDTLALNYTVPAVTDTVTITLEAEAVNANGLTKTSSQDFTATP